jgi:hypothetical protein
VLISESEIGLCDSNGVQFGDGDAGGARDIGHRRHGLESSSSVNPGVIEIEFATGGRMRISGSVAASTVSALMKALAKGRRRR